MDELKLSIQGQLDNLLDRCDRPKKMGNADTVLCDLYFWQEVKKYAADQEKQALKIAQEVEGIIPSDDKMRARGKGEWKIVESKYFEVRADIKNPSRKFDILKYVTNVAKAFGLSKDKMAKMLTMADGDEAKVEGTAALSKYVREI